MQNSRLLGSTEFRTSNLLVSNITAEKFREKCQSKNIFPRWKAVAYWLARKISHFWKGTVLKIPKGFKWCQSRWVTMNRSGSLFHHSALISSPQSQRLVETSKKVWSFLLRQTIKSITKSKNPLTDLIMATLKNLSKKILKVNVLKSIVSTRIN